MSINVPLTAKGLPNLRAHRTRQEIAIAEAWAKKHQPKPSSWWTAHASPASERSRFAVEVAKRHDARLQRFTAQYGNASNEADE